MSSLLTIAIAASTAAAQSPPATAAEPQPEYESYGWKIVIIDAAGVAVTTGGIAIIMNIESDDRWWGMIPCVVGAGTYLFGGAGAHSGHDNKGAATGVPLMKGLITVVGVVAGAKAAPKDRELLGAAIGAGTGVVIATTIDAVWIARAPVPYVAPTDGGATVGLAARF